MSDTKEDKVTTEIKDQDPVIEDEVKPVVKRTTLAYKIDPVLEYFPICEKASLEQLQKIRSSFNEYKHTEAQKLIDLLNLDSRTENENEIKTLLRINLWKAKSQYNFGNYNTAELFINSLIDRLIEKYPKLKK